MCEFLTFWYVASGMGLEAIINAVGDLILWGAALYILFIIVVNLGYVIMVFIGKIIGKDLSY